jgi:hypothetical protein
MSSEIRCDITGVRGGSTCRRRNCKKLHMCTVCSEWQGPQAYGNGAHVSQRLQTCVGCVSRGGLPPLPANLPALPPNQVYIPLTGDRSRGTAKAYIVSAHQEAFARGYRAYLNDQGYVIVAERGTGKLVRMHRLLYAEHHGAIDGVWH